MGFLKRVRKPDYYKNYNCCECGKEIKIGDVYEKEARTRSIFIGKKISNPDFYLPDYNVYVEYWGLVNANDYRTRTNYIRTMKYKMAKYHQNRIKFVSIYPDNLDNLDWIFRAKFRKATGIDLPN